MSPLFRDRVLISLSPTQVSCVRTRPPWRRAAPFAEQRTCETQPDVEPWRAALAVLAILAAELKGQAADVTVLLSNHFVRYIVVPGSERLKGNPEALAFARYCLEKVHGERSRAWELRLSRGRRRVGSRVASAIDRDLLQAVQACFPAGGDARLISVQPLLMASLNLGEALTGRDATWLFLEPQRACLTCMVQGHWVAVRNIKGDFEHPEQWAALLDQERYLLGLPQPASDVLVNASRPEGAAAVQSGVWRFRLLPDASFPTRRQWRSIWRGWLAPPLALDYVAAPSQPALTGVGVLLAALLIAGALTHRYADARRQLAASQSDAPSSPARQLPVQAVPRERVTEDAKRAQEVVRQLTLPWMSMIAAVERAATQDIAVLQMQPEPQQALLRVTAEAGNREAMLKYLGRLEKDGNLAEVHLVRHEVRVDQPGRPIQFVVQARVREAR